MDSAFWGERKKAKPAQCRSIFTLMAAALESEDRLITSLISQNRLKSDWEELTVHLELCGN